jgi:hypothetical protein
MARCRQLLIERLPDVYAGLLAAGVTEAPLRTQMPGSLSDTASRPGDERLTSMMTRRSTVDWVLQRAAAAEPRVTVRYGVKVTGLLTAASRLSGGPPHGPPHVTGVRSDRGDLAADLVVDATGRRSPIDDWLTQIGARVTATSRAECGIAYFSRHYRVRPGAGLPAPRIVAPGLVAGLVRGRSIAGDCYSGFLDHQHLRGRKCHRTVQHPARNRECHAGSQFHGVTTFEFDTQATVDDVEELVLLLVLVPVVLATREDAQAEQDTANLYQGLVVPGVVRPLDRLTDVDELKRTEQRLIVDFVVSWFRHMPTLLALPEARPASDRGQLNVGCVAAGTMAGVLEPGDAGTGAQTKEDPMSDLQAIADRVEIEALRGEFTDAVVMNDYDRLAALFTQDGTVRLPHAYGIRR